LLMFYLGLDLGQRVDHTALAVVERLERARPYGEAEYEGLAVRHVERLPLGVPYPKVVSYVREQVRGPELRQQCKVVVDATGLGAPVVEMLRGAGLGCEILAVTITGGEKESAAGQGAWNVPKRDLIAGLQVLMDVRERSSGFRRARWGAERSGQHDDLVMALALACWSARRVVGKVGFRGGRLF
jgi:hypothetical protein